MEFASDKGTIMSRRFSRNDGKSCKNIKNEPIGTDAYGQEMDTMMDGERLKAIS